MAYTHIPDSDDGAAAGRLAWSLNRLAQAIDASPSFIRLEIQRGRLQATRLGHRVVILDSEVRRYLRVATGARDDARR